MNSCTKLWVRRHAKGSRKHAAVTNAIMAKRCLVIAGRVKDLDAVVVKICNQDVAIGGSMQIAENMELAITQAAAKRGLEIAIRVKDLDASSCQYRQQACCHLNLQPQSQARQNYPDLHQNCQTRTGNHS